jgi:hypothetical protein
MPTVTFSMTTHPPNRARFAAPATVRVRWKDGRGARLTHGLDRPRGIRTPARHRDQHLMRVAMREVTRGKGCMLRRSPKEWEKRECFPVPQQAV